MVDGVRKDVWGRTEDEAKHAWLAWYYGPQEPPPAPPTSAASSEDEVEPPPETMGELFDRYLEHLALDKGGATYDRDESIVRNRLRDRFGALAFPMSRQRVQRYLDELKAADWYTTSIRRELSVIQGAFTVAVRRGWLTQNPAHGLEIPVAVPGVRHSQRNEPHRERVDIPTTEEVEHFLEVNKDDEFWAMWYAGFMLAPRASELVAMSEDQIDTGASGRYEWVYVHRKIRRTRPAPGRLVVEAPKDVTYRDLEVGPGHPIFEVLVDQGEWMRALRAQHPEWDPRWDGYLFRRTEPGKNGRGRAGDVYAPDQINDPFKEACIRAGWPTTRTPHTMRHYCASMLIEEGLNSKQVADWLGDKTVAMVERTYIHLFRRTRRGVTPPDALRAVKLPTFGVRHGVQQPH